MKLQSRILLAAGLAIVIPAAPAWSAQIFSHDQTTLGEEFINTFPNSGDFTVEMLEITVKNSTKKKWTDYHFRVAIPDGGGGPGDFVEVVSVLVPAGPFQAGQRAKTKGATHFDRANFSDGEVPIGDSFTAKFEVKHRSSVNIYGRPTFLPEPESWALMILGFAAAGAGLRRSRRAWA